MSHQPPKFTFNYLNNNPPLYSPKLIQSGYIIGQPVAYTDQPNLPADFHLFSPKHPRQRATTSYPINLQSITKQYQAPQPSYFAPPGRQSFRSGNTSMRKERAISIEQYNSLLERYRELQQKYQQLQQKYHSQMSLKSSRRCGNSQLSRLIENYKQNALKECMLLVDRVRLETKEAELQRRR